jgi:hypothetical protein
MEKRRGAYRVLLGKPEDRRQFGTVRHMWKDDIYMDFQ